MDNPDNTDNSDIDPLLENQSLKFEFALRNLDLDPVFRPTPDDLARENRVLCHLLDWVEKYTTYRDRNRLEAEGYHFPPIDPGISPENDWYHFKEWIHGHPLRAKLKEQLLVDYVPKDPGQLSDDEIAEELETLLDHLAKVNVSVDLQDELPLGLLYEHLLEILDEEFDILVDGMWHMDGCIATQTDKPQTLPLQRHMPDPQQLSHLGKDLCIVPNRQRAMVGRRFGKPPDHILIGVLGKFDRRRGVADLHRRAVGGLPLAADQFELTASKHDVDGPASPSRIVPVFIALVPQQNAKTCLLKMHISG